MGDEAIAGLGKSHRPAARLGSAHAATLRAIHGEFAAGFAAALSGVARTAVEVKLTGVVQLNYGQFIAGLESPGCATVLSAPPLAGRLLADLSPGILYSLIDRMLGGGRDGCVVACRPPTEIELRLLSRINGLLLAQWQRAWENIASLQPEVVRVESNPQMAQIASATEEVVLIGFSIALNQREGSMTLCVPVRAMVPLLDLLVGGGAPVAREGREMTHVELRVALAPTRIGAVDLADLRVGDIITTDHAVDRPFAVSIDGKPTLAARPGAFRGRLAVRICEPAG